MHKLAFHRQFYFSPLHQEFVSGKSWDLQLRQAAEKASQSFLWLWQWLSGITLGGNATLMLHDSCSSRWHRRGPRNELSGSTGWERATQAVSLSWAHGFGNLDLILKGKEGVNLHLENVGGSRHPAGPSVVYSLSQHSFRYFFDPHHSLEAHLISEISWLFPMINIAQLEKFKTLSFNQRMLLSWSVSSAGWDLRENKG